MSKRSRGLLPTPMSVPDSEASHHQMSWRYREKMDEAFSSQRGSPVSPSAQPDEEKERETTATSGRTLCESSPPFGPIGSFLRTLLASSAWYSPIVRLQWKRKPLYSTMQLRRHAPLSGKSSTTLKKQGMKLHRLSLYQLSASARLTSETESGLSATPTESMATMQDFVQAKFHSSKRPKYSEAMLPTPTVPREHDSDETAGKFYESQTRGYLARELMLPTPAARDYKSDLGQQTDEDLYGKNGKPLARTIQYQDGQRTGMKLQPAFALWMMGYPEDWCDLGDGE